MRQGGLSALCGFFALCEEKPWLAVKGKCLNGLRGPGQRWGDRAGWPGPRRPRRKVGRAGTFQHADGLVADVAAALLVERHVLVPRPRRVPGIVPAPVPVREARPGQAGHEVLPLGVGDGVQLHLLPHRPPLHRPGQLLRRRPAGGPGRAWQRPAGTGRRRAGEDAAGEDAAAPRRRPGPPQRHRSRRHPAVPSMAARRHLGARGTAGARRAGLPPLFLPR